MSVPVLAAKCQNSKDKNPKIRTFVEDLIAAKEFADVMSPLALCDLVLLKDMCASLRINQLTQVSTQRLIVYGT